MVANYYIIYDYPHYLTDRTIYEKQLIIFMMYFIEKRLYLAKTCKHLIAFIKKIMKTKITHFVTEQIKRNSDNFSIKCIILDSLTVYILFKKQNSVIIQNDIILCNIFSYKIIV